jgi:uncharacterized protein (DUF302 family)
MEKKSLVSGLVGFVLGLLIMAVVVYNTAPGIMFIEKESKYGFDESVEKFKQATKEKGWKLPKVHDLQKTMAKFGKTVNKVQVFELCHPEHAYKILSRDAERVVVSLMPCRVAIYERSDGKVYVSMMNSGLMGGMMSGVIPEVMGIASKESEEIVDALIK